MDSTAAVPDRRHHAVKFYGDDASLYTTVATFLGEGLIAGQPAIVIATAEHRASAILDQLTARFISVAEAQQAGDLLLLDAEEMLATFLVDGTPDAELFKHNVGGLISRVLAGRPHTVVRAYGEMVDLLWKRGRTEKEAIRLEILWNQLALTHGFALLCGYSIGNFYKQAEEFQEVCRQHTDILESDSDSNLVVLESRRAVRSA